MSERKLSEMLAIVAVIDPDIYGTGTPTQTSSEIDMQMHREIMFIFQTGDIGSDTATMELRIYEGTDEGHGTAGEAWVLLKAATDLANDDDNKQVVINVRADDLSSGYRWIKAVVKIGGTGSAVYHSLVALADRTRFSDAVVTSSYGDLSTVDEIVA